MHLKHVAPPNAAKKLVSDSDPTNPSTIASSITHRLQPPLALWSHPRKNVQINRISLCMFLLHGSGDQRDLFVLICT